MYSLDKRLPSNLTTVLMLDQSDTRRYHIYRDCSSITSASAEVVERDTDSREVQRALLCTNCSRHLTGDNNDIPYTWLVSCDSPNCSYETSADSERTARFLAESHAATETHTVSFDPINPSA